MRRIASFLLLSLLASSAMAIGPTIQVVHATPSWGSTFPSADNRLLRSDGTSGAVQDTGITVDDDDRVTLPTDSWLLGADTTADAIQYRVGNENSGLGWNGTVPAFYVAGTRAWTQTATTFTQLLGFNLNGATPGETTLGVGAGTFAVSDRSVYELTGDAGGNSVATITGAGEGRYLVLTVAALGGGITLVDDDTPAANEIALPGTATNIVLTADAVVVLLRGPTYWKLVSSALN